MRNQIDTKAEAEKKFNKSDWVAETESEEVAIKSIEE